jgi:hypothetical protein
MAKKIEIKPIKAKTNELKLKKLVVKKTPVKDNLANEIRELKEIIKLQIQNQQLLNNQNNSNNENSLKPLIVEDNSIQEIREEEIEIKPKKRRLFSFFSKPEYKVELIEDDFIPKDAICPNCSKIMKQTKVMENEGNLLQAFYCKKCLINRRYKIKI